MIKKEMIAMLLAGGQGSRLGVLTSNLAKPAVAFGGKYKIIDFPLSNCINSGIDTVGVLTQYRPLRLNQHIGIGIPWDLDRSIGGVTVLPPYEKSENSQWYTGTANAIYQNLEYIDYYNPEYVLILSGDHIYKMDYEVMLDYHKSMEADITLATYEVPMEEASRFGVVITDGKGVIQEFEEKPEKPRSNKASMGIYIFTWDKLHQYLISDEENPNSENDFGKNIIPAMLNDNQKLYAYRFEGYWKDVGTIGSLWEANMDLLGETPAFDVGDSGWKIHSRNPLAPPEYIGPEGKVKNSMIALGCEIEGTVEHSVLASNVIVEKGAIVKDAVIMAGTVIKAGAQVTYSILDENVTVGEGAVVGSDKDLCLGLDEKGKGIAVVGRNVKIGDGKKVAAGVIVDADVE